MLKDQNISKNLSIISLEASKALPMAEIGKGPVLRIGDRSTVFDSDISIMMWKAALELQQNKKNKL